MIHRSKLRVRRGIATTLAVLAMATLCLTTLAVVRRVAHAESARRDAADRTAMCRAAVRSILAVKGPDEGGRDRRWSLPLSPGRDVVVRYDAETTTYRVTHPDDPSDGPTLVIRSASPNAPDAR